MGHAEPSVRGPTVPGAEVHAGHCALFRGRADFDGDTVPDLVTANQLSGDVSMLLNQGQRLDSDGDGAPDACDNCPDIANAEQVNINEGENDDPALEGVQAYGNVCEGSISFLKRMLRLAGCFNKSWKHFVATVGQTVFARNLLVLARL